mgnify:CR=1 FL=1
MLFEDGKIKDCKLVSICNKGWQVLLLAIPYFL